MEKRTVYGPDIDPPALGKDLSDWLARQGYQTQTFPSPNGAVTVQARKEDTLRKVAGMSSALTVVVTPQGEYLEVEIGGAKWADKGVVGAVGLVVFFPALITAGVGAYQQSQIQSQTWQFVESYVRSHSAFGGSPVNAVGQGIQAGARTTPLPAGWPGAASPAPGGAADPGSSGTCAQCQRPMPADANFCVFCGAPVPGKCRNCGHRVSPEAKFCEKCGNQVTA